MVPGHHLNQVHLEQPEMCLDSGNNKPYIYCKVTYSFYFSSFLINSIFSNHGSCLEHKLLNIHIFGVNLIFLTIFHV